MGQPASLFSRTVLEWCCDRLLDVEICEKYRAICAILRELLLSNNRQGRSAVETGLVHQPCGRGGSTALQSAGELRQFNNPLMAQHGRYRHNHLREESSRARHHKYVSLCVRKVMRCRRGKTCSWQECVVDYSKPTPGFL